MKPKEEKAADVDNLDVPEIKLERVPVENLAEVTETLDCVRVAAQKLVLKLTEATDRYAESSNETRDRIELGNTSTEVGYKGASQPKSLISVSTTRLSK